MAAKTVKESIQIALKKHGSTMIASPNNSLVETLVNELRDTLANRFTVYSLKACQDLPDVHAEYVEKCFLDLFNELLPDVPALKKASGDEDDEGGILMP